jgi:hypothetical protein
VGVVPSAGKHHQRFREWQNLAPPATRFISAEVETRLVGLLEVKGFRRVGTRLTSPEDTVSGGDIVLERVQGRIVDSITFNFDKRRSPHFQVQGMTRIVVAPHDFMQSASLVARSSQYHHFWGKHWWLPTLFWRNRCSTRQVDAVAARIDQLLQFLETGQRGPNIGKEVIVKPARRD